MQVPCDLPGTGLSQSTIRSMRIGSCRHVVLDFAALLQAPDLVSLSVRDIRQLSYRHLETLTMQARNLKIYLQVPGLINVNGESCALVGCLKAVGFAQHYTGLKFTSGDASAWECLPYVSSEIEKLRAQGLGPIYSKVMCQCGSNTQCQQYFNNLQATQSN